jgi:hypothetical protein
MRRIEGYVIIKRDQGIMKELQISLKPELIHRRETLWKELIGRSNSDMIRISVPSTQPRRPLKQWGILFYKLSQFLGMKW